MPTNVARIAGLQKEWTWKTSGATRIQIRQLLDNNYIFSDGLSFHISRWSFLPHILSILLKNITFPYYTLLNFLFEQFAPLANNCTRCALSYITSYIKQGKLFFNTHFIQYTHRIHTLRLFRRLILLKPYDFNDRLICLTN